MKSFFLFTNAKKLNENQKIEQHLLELKILLLIILLFVVVFAIMPKCDKNSRRQQKRKHNYKFERIDDVENKTACLWNGKGKPCYEIKYSTREEYKNLNDFQKIKLNNEELVKLQKYNSMVIVYKDSFEDNILAVSCPSLSVNKKGTEKFMIKDFVNKKLKAVVNYKDNKITCPAMINK